MNQHEQPPQFASAAKSRRLKIGSTGTGGPRADVPHLRLSGRWLEHAGFAIGQSVNRWSADVRADQLKILRCLDAEGRLRRPRQELDWRV
jgi:hypothetical protein